MIYGVHHVHLVPVRGSNIHRDYIVELEEVRNDTNRSK